MSKKNTVANISLVAKTYYDFTCRCIVDVADPTNEQLQSLADKFYEDIDGGEFVPDDVSWDHVASEAVIAADSDVKPNYRAYLLDGDWEIEEVPHE